MNAIASTRDCRIALDSIWSTKLDPRDYGNTNADLLDDLLGITSMLVPGAVGYRSNPEQGMLGATLLETLRLNEVAYPPGPCVGRISFPSSSGLLVGNARMSVNLNPGQAAFLDSPGSALVTMLGQRAEVQPVVTPAVTPVVTPSSAAGLPLGSAIY
jgi:hypothetical protein